MAETDSNMQAFLDSRKINMANVGQVIEPESTETPTQKADRLFKVALKARVSSTNYP